MAELALLTISGPLASLVMNRPDSRNALSIDLIAALHEQIDRLAAAAEVRVLVLSGAGKSFCAGMDLKQVLNEPGAPLRLLTQLAEFTIKLRALPMVTVAAVNGAAVGGGCGLATVCDFAVTHADSKMGFPEVDLGVCPAVVAPWLMRSIGAGRARRVLLAGGTMSGREAHAIGMVSNLVETREQLDEAVDALAQRIAGGGPAALRATRALLNQLDGPDDAAAVRRGAELSATVIDDPGTRRIIKSKLGM